MMNTPEAVVMDSKGKQELFLFVKLSISRSRTSRRSKGFSPFKNISKIILTYRTFLLKSIL